MDEGLGPILTWSSESDDAAQRIDELLASSLPRIEAYEATFKAALKLSLDQWARRQAGTLGDERKLQAWPPGRTADAGAITPQGEVTDAEFERLAQALSLVFGVETLIVLKDIWGLDGEQTRAVARWMASALIERGAGEDIH